MQAEKSIRFIAAPRVTASTSYICGLICSR